MNLFTKSLVLASSILLSASVFAETFALTSTDIKQGEFMNKAQEFNGFGCDGANISPQLSWSGAPEGTQAFAVFAYDLDAPTGSGWWHWQLVNIDKNVNSLAAGVESSNDQKALQGVTQIKNDYGQHFYGGVCPPVGNTAHRYQFTVYALSQKLDLPQDPSGALTGFMVKSNSLASATIEAHYERK
jgi:hypothetical protein